MSAPPDHINLIPASSLSIWQTLCSHVAGRQSHPCPTLASTGLVSHSFVLEHRVSLWCLRNLGNATWGQFISRDSTCGCPVMDDAPEQESCLTELPESNMFLSVWTSWLSNGFQSKIRLRHPPTSSGTGKFLERLLKSPVHIVYPGYGWLSKSLCYMSSDTFMGVMGKETAIWDSFQQAYERVMDNESRWINLVKLVYYRIVGILTGKH